jgi:hypothetical protein
MRTAAAVAPVLRIRERESGDTDERSFQKKSGGTAHKTAGRRRTAMPGRNEAAGRAVRSYCAARVPRHGSVFLVKEATLEQHFAERGFARFRTFQGRALSTVRFP